MTSPLKGKVHWPQVSLTVCLALMVACASEPKQGTATQTTSASISTGAAPSESRRLPDDAREKAIEAYRDYLARYPSTPERREIMRRLADLLMTRAADLSTATPGSRVDSAARQDYADALAIYEELLGQYPDDAQSPELLYQSARAYEEMGESARAIVVLDGLIEHSRNLDPKLYADAQFRRGELFFEDGSFSAAERSFREVIRVGKSSDVRERAMYKLGWSLFKQDRYEDALDVFFALLDLKIPSRVNLETHLATLSRAEREQVADVFRAISLGFSYLSGVDSVVVYFERHGSRPYERRVYRDLGELYAGKEFYTDAAKTYLTLARREPGNPEAPRLYVEAIALYEEAGLRQSVIETEKAFVQGYGLDAVFWDHHSPQAFPDVVERLESALVELASHYHVLALEQQQETDQRESVQWYRVYLASFGDTERAANMNLRLAELFRDSRLYRRAVDEYERTAYARGAHRWAAEAGRAALLVYAQHEKDLEGEDEARWSQRATASAIRFVESFPLDPDAPAVLANAGVSLLDRGEVDEALRVGETILQRQAPLPAALRQTAWSILAQAHFEKGNYQAAEHAYVQALRFTEAGDPRRSALKEGMAAAIYEHASERLEQGDKDEAVTDFLRAANAAPESSIGPEAQYDAAASLLALGEWRNAISILERFRADYPKHRLQAEVTQKLAFAYARSGQTVAAAAEYLRLGEREGDAALRREALLQAADLYEQAGRTPDAVAALEVYLGESSIPAVESIEVSQRLADLERVNGNKTQRRHWLREVVVADRTAGDARNARTRSLAAHASLELAESRLVSFQRIRLVEPLKDSLDKKLAEMKLALNALEKATEYGIAPVTSAATYKIANMYDELARALRTSQRPSHLSPDEMAQYDLLIEEQAAAFEQRAIEFYEANVLRMPEGQYDSWVEKSLNRLAELWPARYGREERSEADGGVQQALATNTGNPLTYNDLGIRHREAGRFEQARDTYERAPTMRPDYSTAHLNLGILCELY